jgi:hypothetical protein
VTGRGLWGRRIAGLTLLAALALDAMVVLLFVTAPPNDGPMFYVPEEMVRLGLLIPAAGISLNIVGLAWMLRIYRADPERHDSAWRAVRRG